MCATRHPTCLGFAAHSAQPSGALAETARQTAGDRIKTTAELRGNPTPLNLRLAGALLHIGHEAIVNALAMGIPPCRK
jgi:hypothetical protein